MDSEQQLEEFIQNMASKMARENPGNYLDEEDYVQIGRLKLLEVTRGWSQSGRFESYAIVAIARAIRRAVVESTGTIGASYPIKNMLRKIRSLIASGHSEQEIRENLEISPLRWSRLVHLLSPETFLLEEQSCCPEPFAVIDDLMSCRHLTEIDHEFLTAKLSNNIDSLGWDKHKIRRTMVSLRDKLSRSGYGREA